MNFVFAEIRLKQADFRKIRLADKNFRLTSGFSEFYKKNKSSWNKQNIFTFHDKFGWQ